jgi:hypothetical protein
MATHRDYGQPDDLLSFPSLSEWAAAVADKLDETTTALGTKVNRAGDTITGPLIVQGNVQLGSTPAHSVALGVGASFDANGAQLSDVGNPVAPTDAATKGYVDKFAGGLKVIAGPVSWFSHGNGAYMINAANFGLSSISIAFMQGWGMDNGFVTAVVDANPANFTLAARQYNGGPFYIVGNQSNVTFGTLIVGSPA